MSSERRNDNAPLIIGTEIQKAVVVNQADAEPVQPAVPAENISPKALILGKIHGAQDLVVKYLDCDFVSEDTEDLAGRSLHLQSVTILDDQAEVLAVLALEDAVLRSRIQFGPQPHHLPAH